MGTVIVVQGAIVGEKQLGTAAWVMSKPGLPCSLHSGKDARVCNWILGHHDHHTDHYLSHDNIADFVPAPLSLPTLLMAGVAL